MTKSSDTVTIISMDRWHLRSISGLFALYLFFCMIVIGMLFVVGNYQEFLESTNEFLLHLLEWVLFFFCIADIYYFIFFCIDLVSRKKKNYTRLPWTGLIWSGLGLIIGSSSFLLLNAVLIWL